MDAPFPTPESSAIQNIQERAARLQAQVEVEALLTQAYMLYFCLFAVGAMVLLAWVFWPRRKALTLRGWTDVHSPGEAKGGVDRMQVGFGGIVILLLLTMASHQIRIDQRRGFIEDVNRRMDSELRRATAIGPQAREEILQTHYMYLPQGDSLRYISLGNCGLAADYMWLSSLQHVSSPFRQGQKFDLLRRFYDVVLELDPTWVDIHVNAGKILSALDPNRLKTEEFLNQAMTRNPEDFHLPMEAGRLYVVPPGDPRMLKNYSDKAGEYFDKAVHRSTLPSEDRATLEDLIARLKLEAGRSEVAAEYLWKVANDTTILDALRDRSSHQWLQADTMVRVDRIQAEVERFRSASGTPPPQLPALFNGAVPIDAYGHAIQYDPSTGKVTSLGLRCLRAMQVSRVLETLIGMFQGASGLNRTPKDMAELTAFLRRQFAPPNDAPFPVKDALGPDLDCTVNPLGGAWDYDPKTGKINLPHECDPKELFQNRKLARQGKRPPPFRPAP